MAITTKQQLSAMAAMAAMAALAADNTPLQLMHAFLLLYTNCV